MPNCVTLARKTAPEVPVKFAEIDVEICAAVGEPVDEVKYCRGWYDSIGLGLACGNDWNRLRKIFHACPSLLPVITFLEENYVAKAWYSPYA